VDFTMKFMSKIRILAVCGICAVSSVTVFAEAIVDCFRQIESAGSGEYQAVQSSLQMLGRYQMSVSRLMDLGYCSDGSGRPNNGQTYWAWNKDRNQSQNKPGQLNHWNECQWTQKAKDLGINSVDSFLNSPTGQEAIFSSQMSQLEREYQSANLDQYVGTVDRNTGVALTKENLMYMLHNAGPGGAKNYLEGNGNSSETIANIVKMDNCMGGNSTMPPGTGGGNQSLCV
jgi:hypothetical protein